MKRCNLIRAGVVGLALSSPWPLAAQVSDVAATPSGASVTSATMPAPRARFDVWASLAEGDEDLDLATAMRLAEAQSLRLRAAARGVAVAEARRRQAEVALFPRLDVGARYAHVDGFPDGHISLGSATPAQIDAARALAASVSDPAARTLLSANVEAQAAMAAGVSIHIPRDQVAFTARLTVPVSDLVFALYPAFESARDRVDAEALRVEAASRDVDLQAAEALYRHIEARAGLSVAQAGVVQATRVREQLVRYGAAGIATSADVAAAEARLAQAEEAVARANAAVSVTQTALSLLLGTPSERRHRVRSAVDADLASPGNLADLESRALSERADLRAARALVRAEDGTRAAVLASGYPHLALYAAGDLSNPSMRVFPQRDEFIGAYEVGAQLSFSPNELATAAFRREELDAQLARTMEEIGGAEDAVRLALRQAFEESRAASATIEAAEASVAAAELAYEARNAEWQAGAGVLTDLLLADGRVNDARFALVRARVAAMMAEARLLHATGELGRMR